MWLSSVPHFFDRWLLTTGINYIHYQWFHWSSNDVSGYCVCCLAMAPAIHRLFNIQCEPENVTIFIFFNNSSTILGGPRFQEGTRSTKDKLERHSQERSARNGTLLGRGGGGSSQQTRMASECGPIRSRGRGMNQVNSSIVNQFSQLSVLISLRDIWNNGYKYPQVHTVYCRVCMLQIARCMPRFLCDHFRDWLGKICSFTSFADIAINVSIFVPSASLAQSAGTAFQIISSQRICHLIISNDNLRHFFLCILGHIVLL